MPASAADGQDDITNQTQSHFCTHSCLLLVAGPLGKQGRLVNLYGGLLRNASEHMKKEHEAAEREAGQGKKVWGIKVEEGGAGGADKL
jgi:hypothetical protein